MPFQFTDYLNVALGSAGTSDPGDLDTYVPLSTADMPFTRFKNTVRGATVEEIKASVDNKTWEAISTFAYQTGMSMVDSAAMVAMFGPGASVILGSAAAADQTKAVIDSGGTTDQALLSGLAAGVAEMVFEKVSIDNLLKPSNVSNMKSWVKAALKQGGVEASEEVATEIANILSDAVIMGQNSEFNRLVQSYIRDGMSAEKATARAYLDMVGKVALAAVGGFLSGGIMSGAYNAPAAITGGQKNAASTGEAGQYRAEKPQNVELPTVPIINLSMQDVAALNGGTMPQTGNYIRKTAYEDTVKRLGLDKNEAAYIEASNVTRNGDAYVIKLTKPALNKMLSASSYESKIVPLESIAVLKQIERIAQNGVWYDSEGDRQNRPQIAGYDYLKTTAYIDGEPYVVNMRVRVEDQKAGGDNRLYHFTPETIEVIKKDDGTTSTAGRHATSIKSEVKPSPELTVPQLENKVNSRTAADSILRQAAAEVANRGSISNNTAERIMADADAMAELGVDIGGKTKSQTRQAVKEAVAALADNPSVSSADTSPYTGEALPGALQMASEGETGRRITQARQAAASFGENGSRAFEAAYDEATASTLSAEDAFEGFAKVYNAALKGETVESSLPAHMKLAAEYAGQNDAIRAKQATYWGEESGVVKDSYFKKAHLSSRTVRVLDAIAKAAGVKIRFAETVTDSAGRAANACYADGVITIALNAEDPVRAAFTHEIVHRIRETAPAQYQALVRFVQNHISQQTLEAMSQRYGAEYNSTDISKITEEMVAEAFGTMLGDSKAMEQFVRDDRNAAEKLRDVILDLINAVKRILNGQNVRLTKDQRDSFMELKSDLEGMEKALTQALKAIPKEGQKNTATVGGEVKYSAKTQAEVTRQYEKAVDAILNGTSKIQDSVLLGYTPEIYRELGMPSLPFVVGAGHIYSAAKTEAEARSEGKYNSKTNYHGLGGQAVKKLYQAASKPIAIISAKDVDANATPMRSTHSVVAIVDVGSGKNSLLLPIEITATRRVDGQQMDVNVLSSAYMRNVEGLINEAVAQENVGQTGVYFIKNEASALIGAGVQFPKRLQEAMASNGIVRRFSEKVNMNILEQTQSQQFKRWFGDWQNRPQNASKVVNSDGTPRIVYHGTNADFRTFQSKDGLYWFSESEDYAESMAEERGGDRIMQVYLNMRNPYRAKLAPGKFSDPSAEAPIIQAAKAGNHDGVIIEVDTDNELEMDTFYVVFEQSQIKSANDNIGTFGRNNPNIEYSLKSTPGSWAKTAETARRMAELNKRYGTIKPGENPVRDVQVPKRTSENMKTSQTVRTVMEAAATPEEALPDIEALVAEGEFSYEVYGDKTAVSEANEYISNRGWGEATREWFKAMEKGEVSKRNTAVGWTLYNNAVNSGDTELAIDVLNAMVEHQRNAAQALQATRILKKLSPETQLYAIQRSVGRLQQELNDKYRRKGAPELKIDPDLAEELLNAPDQKARDEAMKMIYRDVGRQMPSRFMDKWTAWRYLAMLGNARTHVRNVVGNAAFAPVVGVKNLTATAIEAAVNRVSGGRTGRSKSLVTGLTKNDRELLSAAWGDYTNVEEAAMGGGKYNDGINTNRYIEEGRRVFGRTEQAKTAVGRAVSGTVGKAVEVARKGNSRLLDVEDKWFSKPHYAAALASYCKANGITAEELRAVNGQKKTASKQGGGVVVYSGKSALERPSGLSYTLASNRDKISDMSPVKTLTGTEMNDRSKKPSEQIADFFAKIGNAVFRPGFGKVTLNDYGVGGMVNHRPLNRAKMVSLEAVPEVIRSGRVIADTDNWKGRGYRSIVFAAPVTIKDKLVYVAAVVDQRPDNKFYLVECVDSEGNFVRIDETPSGDTKSGVTAKSGVTTTPKGASSTIINGENKPVNPELAAKIDEARAYAIREAQRATYRDTNAFSTAISQLGKYEGKNPVKRGISTAAEGVLPFRKTPANILARGLEYSPAGIVKSLTYDLYKVKQGDMTAAELIDDLSAGLTGTGLMALGAFLAAQGLIRGHGGDDEDKREFEELMGHQSYSLEVGGKSVTLDWLAPECLPFFVGVNLWETTQGAGEEVTLSAILSAVGTVTEPLLEMSCLQSLNEIFDAVGYAQSEGLSGLPSALVSAATSYVTQGIPTLLGQIERSGQGERMTTYTEKGAFLTSDMQYTLGSVSGKALKMKPEPIGGGCALSRIPITARA